MELSHGKTCASGVASGFRPLEIASIADSSSCMTRPRVLLDTSTAIAISLSPKSSDRSLLDNGDETRDSLGKLSAEGGVASDSSLGSKSGGRLRASEEIDVDVFGVVPVVDWLCPMAREQTLGFLTHKQVLYERTS